ncbi:branched-chain amino acid transport system II carrier protein [Anaerobacillus sp. HL2]|nr:branched-chain amino acid transport system II carrier protein [Anaerobacillus sp. HL2]
MRFYQVVLNFFFGPSGKLLLGLIVLLACFTTCVGLTIACSQYFTKCFKD